MQNSHARRRASHHKALHGRSGGDDRGQKRENLVPR
jgi:hypothetical protein